MTKNKKPLSRKDDIVVQEMDGEVLIYDLRANKAFCLNETSAVVWHACDGSRSVKDLTKVVADSLNSPANEDLVWLALDQLKKEKLLAEAPDTAERFAGMSRRDVIRRIGVGSLVALPIVAGLVAPPAYAQTSACGVCNCNNGGVNAGDICGTTGPGAGAPCPTSPPGCTVCRANTTGMNVAGTCFPT